MSAFQPHHAGAPPFIPASQGSEANFQPRVPPTSNGNNNHTSPRLGPGGPPGSSTSHGAAANYHPFHSNGMPSLGPALSGPITHGFTPAPLSSAFPSYTPMTQPNTGYAQTNTGFDASYQQKRAWDELVKRVELLDKTMGSAFQGSGGGRGKRQTHAKPNHAQTQGYGAVGAPSHLPGAPSFTPASLTWSPMPKQQASYETPMTRELALYLDQLLALTYPNQWIHKDDCNTLLSNLARLVALGYNEQISKKLSTLIVTLISKQQITFNNNTLDFLITAVLDFIKNSSGEAKVEALRALGYLLYENGSRCTRHHQQLLWVLLPLCDPNTSPEIQRMAINCVGNLCAKTGAKMHDHYTSIFELLYNNFTRYLQAVLKDVSYCKILASTTRAMQFVITEGRTLHEPHLSVILPALRKLMFYATSLVPAPVVPAPTDRDRGGGYGLQTSSDSDTSAGDTLDRSLWKVRLHSLTCLQAIARCSPKLFFGWWTTFLPDSPHPLTPSLFTVLLHDPIPKVRVAAAAALATILDGSKAYLFAADERPRGGTAAATGGGGGGSGTRTSSYVPYARTLVAIVRELHTGLLAAMDNEVNTKVLNQVIKCVTVLVSNTPYERLASGLLTGILSRLLGFAVCYKDLSVRTTALSCLGSIMLSSGPLPEVTAFLQLPVSAALAGTMGPQPTPPANQQAAGPLSAASSPGSRSVSPHGDSPQSGSALLEQLLVLATSDTLSIKTEALHVLGCLARHYYSHLAQYWPQVFSLLTAAVGDGETNVRLHACKVFEECSKAVAALEGSATETGIAPVLSGALTATPSPRPKPASAPGSPRAVPSLGSLALWQQLLGSGLLATLFVDSFHSVRACICGCLSHVPPSTFAQFTAEQRAQCIGLVLAAVADEAPAVRASACRTLGVFVLFPVQYVDVTFLRDTVAVLMKAMTDGNFNVRTKACWSIGNLCDAIIMAKETPGGPGAVILDQLSTECLLQITECALKAVIDKEKIRANAVRTLGNFSRFAPPALLSHVVAVDTGLAGSGSSLEELSASISSLGSSSDSPHTLGPAGTAAALSEPRPLLEHIAAVLVANMSDGSAKVRWNSCYAVGNAFHNPHVCEALARNEPLGSAVLGGLVAVVQECKNFKTRINGALSLSVPPRREHFPGNTFVEAVAAVLNALENIEAMQDFTEYKYKETLQRQLTVTFVHLMTLAGYADYATLSALLVSKIDVVYELFKAHLALLEKRVQGIAPDSSAPSRALGKGVKAALTTVCTMLESHTEIPRVQFVVSSIHNWQRDYATILATEETTPQTPRSLLAAFASADDDSSFLTEREGA